MERVERALDFVEKNLAEGGARVAGQQGGDAVLVPLLPFYVPAWQV